ncbi:HIT domain protein [bacterium YEK0313]|nr:HIT domain protein [bacterium YEK0313]
MNSDDSFELDPRLAADTERVADLALCRVGLMNDATYPWLILVPRRASVTEIVDLTPYDATLLMDEIRVASRVLRDLTRCDKLNVAALGNMVPQLHVHVIARFRGDPAWPGPVWGKVPAEAYGDAPKAALVEALRTGFGA